MTIEPPMPHMSLSEIGRALGMKTNDVAYLERRAVKYIREQLRSEIMRDACLRRTFGHLIGGEQ